MSGYCVDMLIGPCPEGAAFTLAEAIIDLDEFRAVHGGGVAITPTDEFGLTRDGRLLNAFRSEYIDSCRELGLSEEEALESIADFEREHGGTAEAGGVIRCDPCG